MALATTMRDADAATRTAARARRPARLRRRRTVRRAAWPARLLTAATLLLLACAARSEPEASPGAAPCLAVEPASAAADIEWALRKGAQERAALNAWCLGVGPAVVADYGAGPEPAALDSLAIVVWNAGVGQGRIAELIRDLRAGALTGEPVRDFVILLQETHRSSDGLPQTVPERAAVPRRLGNPGAPGRLDVVELARGLGLALLYAPSMRNGKPPAGEPYEDRGNAILSTLELSDPAVLELPFEGQRRVAILASVRLMDRQGRSLPLRLASVHLDNRARFARLFRTLGAARAAQARTIADHISGDTASAVGGDLNTWVNGHGEAAVRTLRAVLPLPARIPAGATHEHHWLPPLDYLFFRLPDGWDATYRVADSTYGSDHYPLLGRITAPRTR